MNTDMQVSPEAMFTETEIGRQKTANRKCDADFLPRDDESDDYSAAAYYWLPPLQGTPRSLA